LFRLLIGLAIGSASWAGSETARCFRRAWRWMFAVAAVLAASYVLTTHVKRSPDTHLRDRPNQQDNQPEDVSTDEREIDQILADSFPASDAPPWTLGVTSKGARSDRTRKRHRD
jgi:hypothetical protein